MSLIADDIDAWITRYGQQPRVKRWLARNPPPATWLACPEAWAYLEMFAAPGTVIGWVVDSLERFGRW